MRVASLHPYATELLDLLDSSRGAGGKPGGCAPAGGLLVGCTHLCDQPAGRPPLPVLTRPEAPRQLDQQVREPGSPGLLVPGLYTLDIPLLVAVHPDLVLVCQTEGFPGEEAVRAATDQMSPPPAILALSPHTVEDVFEDLLRIGHAAGREAEARSAAVLLRERFFNAADYVASFAAEPTVAFLEWTDPLRIGGHWVPQLIERAGGVHPLNPTVAVADAGAAAGPMQALRRAGRPALVPHQALVALDPDRLILCPRGMPLAEARPMTGALSRQEWWGGLRAVRGGQVALVDGAQMFHRPGPRLVDAFQWLVGWLNDRPELIPRGFPWQLLR
jgi:iron complex transport system substrate-binding protein